MADLSFSRPEIPLNDAEYKFLRLVKMADNSASFAKIARFVAIFQITTGVLLFFFGIADRSPRFKTEVGPGSVCYGIWIGIWVGKILLKH